MVGIWKLYSTSALLMVAQGAPVSVPSATSPLASIVGFGDELSDNGNGSFAHGMTDGTNVYGYGTWTNGPVAISYMADALGLPLTDYAFGGCCGGGSAGATLDNTYTASDAGSPSLQDQVANYTSAVNGGALSAGQSLGFIWVGQNDLSHHTDAFWLGDPNNQKFADSLSSYTVSAVTNLLDLGMPYVFVSNLPPKQIMPVTPEYLCGGTDNSCTETWGQVITNANQQLEQTLTSTFGDKVIYYDSFSYITNLANDAVSLGFTQPLTKFCDGQGDQSWDECMVTGKTASGQTEIVGWDDFFWMNFIQPTTRVHQLIGEDMANTVKAAING